ncbi:MAG: S8 family serine peptidase [Phaeodactylibacter sp.]|nr:S8 family serine peptidase [Phaeodactylibacter sp.]
MDREVVFSEDSIPHYIKGEVIIRFASPVLDSSFVDNTKLHYGPLCEVVTDTALLHEMEQLLEPAPGEEACDCQLVKAFPGLTTEELCITTLDGNPLYIPPFWTTMLLKNCTTGKNELAVSAGLDSISAGRIVYAHPNFVGTGNADCEDPLCDEQHSLWDTPNTDYPEEASINILPAWDHSTGKPEVKVGLFDSGIFYQHEDFGYGSVVEESWDFVNGSSQNVITTSEDLLSHGTRGAGIIGGHTGTSAAAPHATGVAALLASASEQVRLSVEDLEHIMQYTADDLESPFYDQRTAWGRLNAGAALEFIQENRVLHFSAEPDVVEYWCDHSLLNSVCGIEMQGNYLYDDSGFAINTGDQFYRIDVVRHTWNIGLDICALTNDPNALIVDSAEKPGYWVRNSASTLWGMPEDLLPPPDPPDLGYYGVRPYAMVDFETSPTINGCVFQGQLSGYSYAIYDATGQKLLGTMPAFD